MMDPVQRISANRAAWMREESLLRAGSDLDELARLEADGWLERWEVPRRRAGRSPIVLWTLSPWGAAMARQILDERPYSEVPRWRDAVEDLAALGPIRVANYPGECRMPHPERLPDLRDALAPDPDAPAPGPVQATDPVSGEPWVLFAQRFPVLVDRRLARTKSRAR